MADVVITKPVSTAAKIVHHGYKAIISLIILGVIAVGTIAVCITLMAMAHQQHLQNKAVLDKTSQGSQIASIVWPDGTSQNTIIDEEITPAKSSYKAGGYTSHTVVDAITFNPMDRASNATEKMSPEKFTEGPRPGVQLNPGKVTSTATESGAELTGSSGNTPSVMDFIPWIVLGLGCLLFLGVLKPLWDWIKKAIVTAGTVVAPEATVIANAVIDAINNALKPKPAP